MFAFQGRSRRGSSHWPATVSSTIADCIEVCKHCKMLISAAVPEPTTCAWRSDHHKSELVLQLVLQSCSWQHLSRAECPHSPYTDTTSSHPRACNKSIKYRKGARSSSFLGFATFQEWKGTHKLPFSQSALFILLGAEITFLAFPFSLTRSRSGQ